MRLPKLTFGKVLGGTAVVLALTTGTAFAHGMVNSADIVDGSVKSVDIKNGGVKSVDVLDESLTDADLATDAVGATEIQDDSIDAGEIQSSSIPRSDLSFNIPIVKAAFVQSNGTLTRDIGVVSSSRTGVGAYAVVFDQTVTSCYPQVTTSGGQADEAIASISGSTVNVDLENPNVANTNVDLDFYITLVCPS